MHTWKSQEKQIFKPHSGQYGNRISPFRTGWPDWWPKEPCWVQEVIEYLSQKQAKVRRTRRNWSRKAESNISEIARVFEED